MPVFSSSKSIEIKQDVKRFFSVNEVATYLGCSRAVIRKWVREGGISYYKINGLIRFDMQKILKWIEKNANAVKET